jgi:hypothetical protein
MPMRSRHCFPGPLTQHSTRSSIAFQPRTLKYPTHLHALKLLFRVILGESAAPTALSLAHARVCNARGMSLSGRRIE